MHAPSSVGGVYATHPTEMFYFDYLYRELRVDEKRYVLVMQDDLSSYQWLTACNHPHSETVTSIMAPWVRVSTVMKVWVSD